MKRRCIIISPYFPPSSLAGVHRARHLVKHLPAAGWEPTLLCVDERDYEEANDAALFSLVPESAELVRVRAWSARLTRLIGVGEVSLRAFFSLRKAVMELLSARSFDVVLITGGPFYPLLLSGMIRKRFNVPIVLDFQDPWVSAWGAKQKRFSKAGVSHALAERLEPRAVRRCSWITSVSEIQNRQMANRYTWLDSARMSAIPIGSDPADFDQLRKAGGNRATQWLESDCVNLSYVGTFLPEAGPLACALFSALAELRQRAPDAVNKLRLNFIGTSNQPNVKDSYSILPLAREAGVVDLVRETPGRIPYLDALRVLANSDGVLMIGSTEPHYTASKIYPGLMCGKPFLSLFHASSSAHEILSGAGGGIALDFGDELELEGLVEKISTALAVLVSDPGSLGAVDPASYAPFEASRIAERYAEIFARLAKNRADSGLE